MFDVVITGGTLIDGTGARRTLADVGVRDGRISAVGPLVGERAGTRVDADGQIVAPGFVDMHAHSDLRLLADPAWELKLVQGVTTEVIGQDGMALAPVSDTSAEFLATELRGWNGDPGAVDWNWHTVQEYLDRFDDHVAPNVAMLAGHGTTRLVVMGADDRAPTDGELDEMRAAVDVAMSAGCVGLSTGLTYAPCQFASDAELVSLCEVVADHGGYYAPHHRNYGARAVEGYADSIEIGRRAGVPVHLTHAHLGFPMNKGRAGELLALVDMARDAGVDVTLDSYPYLAGNSTLHACLPGWARAGGVTAMRQRLLDGSVRERIRHEMEVDGSDGFQGVPIDWSLVVVSSATVPEYRHAIGTSIAAAAAAHGGGTSPFDFYCDLLVAEDFAVGALTHIGNEENVRQIMQHPEHMVGSDGIVVGDRPHPRAWGSHARYLAHYTRDLGLFSLEAIVRKMTSLPARRLGIRDRGTIRVGAAADVVCFDADTIADNATYENPRALATGVSTVLVNGSPVVVDGRHTGRLPGRVLRPDRSVTGG